MIAPRVVGLKRLRLSSARCCPPWCASGRSVRLASPARPHPTPSLPAALTLAHAHFVHSLRASLRRSASHCTRLRFSRARRSPAPLASPPADPLAPALATLRERIQPALRTAHINSGTIRRERIPPDTLSAPRLATVVSLCPGCSLAAPASPLDRTTPSARRKSETTPCLPHHQPRPLRLKHPPPAPPPPPRERLHPAQNRNPKTGRTSSTSRRRTPGPRPRFVPNERDSRHARRRCSPPRGTFAGCDGDQGERLRGLFPQARVADGHLRGRRACLYSASPAMAREC